MIKRNSILIFLSFSFSSFAIDFNCKTERKIEYFELFNNLTTLIDSEETKNFVTEEYIVKQHEKETSIYEVYNGRTSKKSTKCYQTDHHDNIIKCVAPHLFLDKMSYREIEYSVIPMANKIKFIVIDKSYKNSVKGFFLDTKLGSCQITKI